MMNSADFNKHLDAMQKITVDTLKVKAAEYAANGDRLHNFRVAAAIEGKSKYAALGGMMAKHTVSVYDLLRYADEGREIPKALWEEKIKDSINYLYLLWAMVNEEDKK